MELENLVQRPLAALLIFIDTYSRIFTTIALFLAAIGMLITIWESYKFSKIRKIKSNLDYSIILLIAERASRHRWGAILIGLAIIIQLVVELCQ
jgi:hypothetical protein